MYCSRCKADGALLGAEPLELSMKTLRTMDTSTGTTGRERYADRIILHITGMSPKDMTL